MMKLAIFDMDGLMFDTERISGEILIAIGKAHGYPITMATRCELLGRNEKDKRAILLGHFGEAFPYDAIMNERQKRVSRYYEEHGVPIKEGLVELLQYLKAHHIPVAVCSSSNRAVIQHHIQNTHTANYVDWMIGGDMVTQSKPDPTIFLTACHHFHVAPEDAMVFEDSENGILAANAAHIPVICVPDLVQHSPEFLKKTYRTVSSLREAINVLEEKK